MMRELLRGRLLPRVTLTLFFASASILHAQDYRAKVQGTVNDSSGAVIAGSQVTLSNVKTGISTKKTTNDSGQYIFDFVEPGTYTLIAEQTGFSKFQQENFTVQVRADVTINPVLSAGGVAEQVTVSENVVAVKFNTSGVDLTIDRKMLTDLPILGRNPFRLALLDPSVVDRGWGANNPFDMWGAANDRRRRRHEWKDRPPARRGAAGNDEQSLVCAADGCRSGVHRADQQR